MRKNDPFRLEGMDTFSNLLYVAETRRALAFLAHSVTEIDKYRVETSCVVGKSSNFQVVHKIRKYNDIEIYRELLQYARRTY